MASPRRIVPDNSVILPAFFKEDLTDRAKRLSTAIKTRNVVAFAPESLIQEFVKTASKKADEGISYEQISLAIKLFLDLEITYTSLALLAEDAFELTRSSGISQPDSWYVACAIRYDAELWLSHRHTDGLAGHAARAHKGKVFTLYECSFDKPSPTKIM